MFEPTQRGTGRHPFLCFRRVDNRHQRCAGAKNWFEEAINSILEKIGFQLSNYGNALAEFEAQWMHLVTPKTTVIIVGDARGNGANPRLDVFNRLSRKSRRLIWLNPEHPFSWGTGLRHESLRDTPVLQSRQGLQYAGASGSRHRRHAETAVLITLRFARRQPARLSAAGYRCRDTQDSRAVQSIIHRIRKIGFTWY